MECRHVQIKDVATINANQYSLRDAWQHIQYLDTGNVTKGSISSLQQFDPSSDKVPSRARRKVKANSIVYSMVRPNQEHYAILGNPPTDMLVSTGFAVIDANQSVVSPNYLYYALTTKAATKYFHALAEQCVSTYPTLSVSDLGSYTIALPPIDSQKRIEKVLSDLDARIALNTKLNGYLEELASVLYKKFVASADGRMGTLADLVELQKDGARAGKHPELPYMPIDVMPMKHFGVTEFKANEEAKSSLQLFRRDDIVIGAMRVYFHRVVLAPCEGITRNTCFVLRPRSSSLREYALLTCFQPEAIEYANVRSKGSTMPYAVWENSFETYPVLIPEEGQLDRFSRQLAPLIDQIRDSCRENNKLASLRDALLPKLMSGEIDVSKIDLTQLNSHLA